MAIPQQAMVLGYSEVRPVVASVYPLSAIVAAQQEFSAKRHTGKIILQP